MLSLIDTAVAENDSGRALELTQSAVAAAESLRLAGATDVRFQRVLACRSLRDGQSPAGDWRPRRRPGQLRKRLSDLPGDPGRRQRRRGELRRSLALCHKRLGAIIAVEEPAQAIVHMRRAVELDEAGVADLPASPQRRRDLSTSNIQLGYALMRIGDPAGALAAYHLARELREDLLRDDAERCPGAARPGLRTLVHREPAQPGLDAPSRRWRPSSRRWRCRQARPTCQP